jgi:hypothetical protein
LQARISVDDVAGIYQLTVDLAGHGGFGQARTNGCCDLGTDTG